MQLGFKKASSVILSLSDGRSEFLTFFPCSANRSSRRFWFFCADYWITLVTYNGMIWFNWNLAQCTDHLFHLMIIWSRLPHSLGGSCVQWVRSLLKSKSFDVCSRSTTSHCAMQKFNVLMNTWWYCEIVSVPVNNPSSQMNIFQCLMMIFLCCHFSLSQR